MVQCAAGLGRAVHDAAVKAERVAAAVHDERVAVAVLDLLPEHHRQHDADGRRQKREQEDLVQRPVKDLSAILSYPLVE